LRLLKVTIDETLKNWDEKAWIDKYAALPRSNFKWKAPWMNNAIYTMSRESKIWVPLISVTRYINYTPAFVTRQVKRSTKSKMNVDKEVMDSLKKGMSILLKKVEVEKEKNWLAQLDIKEERRIRAQYMVQLEEERSAIKAAESDMRDYQKRAEFSKSSL